MVQHTRADDAPTTSRVDDDETTTTVRPRRPDDLEACVAALRTVHLSENYPAWWPSDPVGWMVPDGYAAGWVAIERGSAGVLGHVCVVTGIEDPAACAASGVPADRLVSVSRLFVTPAARGRGLSLGARLLAAATAWSADRGLQLMLDVVEDGAPAIDLYERLGWRLVDRRPATWSTPEGEHWPVRVYLAP